MDNDIEEVSYVYEYWDCGYCGAVGVRGDHEGCDQCGHPRDADVTFYRREDLEEVIEDGEQLERFTEGPDWACAFCEALNRQGDSVCRSCGATKDESTKNYFEIQAKKESRQAERAPTPPPSRSSGVASKFAIGCGAFLILAIGLVWWLTREHDVSYEVAAVSWERTIPIERYIAQQRVDWENEIKGEAIERVSSSKEIRKYEKRQVGTRKETYTDNEKVKTGTKKECKTTYKSTGSGASKKVKKCKNVPIYKNKKVTKTRTVPRYKEFPIYANKITYRSKAFGPHKTASAKGADNAPKWPELDLGAGVDGKADRQGNKTEKYEVSLKLQTGDGPKAVKLSTNSKRFESVYKLGSAHKFKVTTTGTVHVDKQDKLLTAD